jgi:hypothetical protein
MSVAIGIITLISISAVYFFIVWVIVRGGTKKRYRRTK